MKIIDKIKMINTFNKIFAIKSGEIIIYDKKYYQSPRWSTFIFDWYYSLVLFGGSILFLFLLGPHYFDSLYLQFFETLILYLLIEYLLALLMPIKQVSQFKGLKEEIKERKDNWFS